MAVTGVSHVSLTVNDLARSCAWYHEVLGWEQRSEGRSDTTTFAYGTLPGGTTLVLRVHDGAGGESFDERRTGLDHLSFAASDVADLTEVERRLESAGTRYTPVQALPFATILAFRDPDNVALELFGPPM